MKLLVSIEIIVIMPQKEMKREKKMFCRVSFAISVVVIGGILTVNLSGYLFVLFVRLLRSSM